MSEKKLFSLEKCMKCNDTKKLISDNSNIEIITYPHEIDNWSKDQLNQAKDYNVFEDLKRTAPILWVDGQKIIGFLRIKKWIQDNL